MNVGEMKDNEFDDKVKNAQKAQTEEMKNKLQELAANTAECIKNILPWSSIKKELISENTDLEFVKSYLNSCYLFPVSELTISNEIEDIPKYINERYHNIIAAAYSLGITLITVIRGERGVIRLYIGYMLNEKIEEDIFPSLLNGALPGGKIFGIEKVPLSELLRGYNHGGVITGVPSIETDDEKLRFNISSVVRSLYGNEYTILTIAKPISKEKARDQFEKINEIKDYLHQCAKLNITEGHGVDLSTGSSISKPNVDENGKKLNTNISFFLALGTITKNYSETKVENKGEAHNINNSISYDKISSIHEGLEKIADHFIERMGKALSTGYWETTITFATKGNTASEILGRSYAGELSKPSKIPCPPQCFFGDIISDELIFIPKEDKLSSIFPNSFSNYLNSEELSLIASPPIESLPGFEIKKMPQLCLTDLQCDPHGHIIGQIADYGKPISGSSLTLSMEDLNKHIFVCGITGSGKTTTVKHILKSIHNNKHKLPFLVLEMAKRDYRKLLADQTFENELRVFSIGDSSVNPIRINPFYVLAGVHVQSHIDNLKAIFNASFSMYGPMPHILEKCIHNIYLKRGWNLTKNSHPFFNRNDRIRPDKDDFDPYKYEEHYYFFPTISDLKDEVNSYIKNELEYKGEFRDNIRTAIVTRLESLCVGSKGNMFNTNDFIQIEELLEYPTIFEIESLADDDDKAFFVGLILTLISEYRQLKNPAVAPWLDKKEKGLQHLLVIEEAHRLLKNVSTEKTSEMVGNPKGKAVDSFCNLIAEMRSCGQGVIVVEQIPTKISPDVIKNSNTKIVHRLVARDDQQLLAGALGITDEDTLYLNRLKPGFMLCHKEGMERPVECKVQNDVIERAKDSDMIKRVSFKELHPYEVYELNEKLGILGKSIISRFINTICTISDVQCKTVVDLLIEKLANATISKNITSYEDIYYREYAIKCAMDVLTHGAYRISQIMPSNFKKSISDLIMSPGPESHIKFISLIKKYWGGRNPEDHIIKIITIFNESIVNDLDKFAVRTKTALMSESSSTITKDGLIKLIEKTYRDLVKNIGSFFLISNNNITNKILINIDKFRR